jgi:hypothetical protein
LVANAELIEVSSTAEKLLTNTNEEVSPIGIQNLQIEENIMETQPISDFLENDQETGDSMQQAVNFRTKESRPVDQNIYDQINEPGIGIRAFGSRSYLESLSRDPIKNPTKSSITIKPAQSYEAPIDLLYTSVTSSTSETEQPRYSAYSGYSSQFRYGAKQVSFSSSNSNRVAFLTHRNSGQKPSAEEEMNLRALEKLMEAKVELSVESAVENFCERSAEDATEDVMEEVIEEAIRQYGSSDSNR